MPTWEKVADVDSLEGEPGPLERRVAMADMCVFGGNGDEEGGEALYVGSWRSNGFNVYKGYDAEPYDPGDPNWYKVAENGIASPLNHGVHKLVVFGDRLWILTVNFLQGFGVCASLPGHVIGGNDDWELMATGGFTDGLNSYAWNAVVYPVGEGGEEIEGSRLFIGTFNPVRGFTLYSVTADLEWAVEVGPGSSMRNGIWTPLNYGVRTLEVWDGKLIIGCAGMFKPLDVWMAWQKR